ncbi:MAG: deoxyribodipyrimidine photolyase, partial [Thermoleophilia bacterium]|nr:deoxyribodipyrimidine photolyase [Thermoleophilia bacterium]
TRQYAARTLRPRIHKVLAQFEGELGSDRSRVTAEWPTGLELADGIELWHDPTRLLDDAWVTRTLAAARAHGIADVAGVLDFPRGLAAARARLHQFVEHGLSTYADDRNQPHLDGTSGLSTFVHYGQIAPHEIVHAVRHSGGRREGIDTFIEEFVVRRELAWNYALHTPDCREWDALPDWARRTLEDHAGDERPVIHSEADMVACATRDPLWNAAQAQMRDCGIMHGYLRMYWAKQILTWTRTPQEAFDIALRLHDRFSLDARDPNSITGVSWAIGGVHDRGWPEREIFGKVRSMTFASTGRKFDKAAYIGRWSEGPVQLTLG